MQATATQPDLAKQKRAKRKRARRSKQSLGSWESSSSAKASSAKRNPPFHRRSAKASSAKRNPPGRRRPEVAAIPLRVWRGHHRRHRRPIAAPPLCNPNNPTPPLPQVGTYAASAWPPTYAACSPCNRTDAPEDTKRKRKARVSQTVTDRSNTVEDGDFNVRAHSPQHVSRRGSSTRPMPGYRP